jgi:hypothetical protein
MKNSRVFLMLLLSVLIVPAAFGQGFSDWLGDLPHPKDYRLKRVSSWDRAGGNVDRRQIDPSATLTILDEQGPAVISHIWITIASEEKYHLKKIVLRMYWDGESEPSVETPIGDFFGLGNGDYFQYQSLPLAVGSTKALNSFFPMPFQKSARITVTNEGEQKVGAFYYNIDVRVYDKPLPPETFYFHAQYQQATPCDGWTNDWKSNTDEKVGGKPNLDGTGNYVFMEATGRGHFVGVTQSIFQNQDDWWGEGDDMIFIDGEPWPPRLHGTGSEDYFNTAYGPHAEFCSPYQGLTVNSGDVEWPWRGKNSLYRFHIEDPVYFEKSIKVTIEHGHANSLTNDYSSTAYWYQIEPHQPFPRILPVELRLPRP